MGNLPDKILHYRIKYQNSNIAIIQFSKKEICYFLENSSPRAEKGESPYSFWECFEEALMEIYGVIFVMAEGYELIVIKDTQFPNWGRIIEDVIWCSIFFLNPGGGAFQTRNNGEIIGKLIEHRFDAIEPDSPKPPRKK